jgi:formylmethanofuran dehydrogenase subunit E
VSDVIKIKCVECDNLFVDDDVKYLYKGKPYCYACYRRIKTEELEDKNKTISSKMSKFGKGFKIPDDE